MHYRHHTTFIFCGLDLISSIRQITFCRRLRIAKSRYTTVVQQRHIVYKCISIGFGVIIVVRIVTNVTRIIRIINYCGRLSFQIDIN